MKGRVALLTALRFSLSVRARGKRKPSLANHRCQSWIPPAATVRAALFIRPQTPAAAKADRPRTAPGAAGRLPTASAEDRLGTARLSRPAHRPSGLHGRGVRPRAGVSASKRGRRDRRRCTPGARAQIAPRVRFGQELVPLGNGGTQQETLDRRWGELQKARHGRPDSPPRFAGKTIHPTNSHLLIAHRTPANQPLNFSENLKPEESFDF